ncbi:hypothetical protein [Streptomyces sp. NPDC093544]
MTDGYIVVAVTIVGADIIVGIDSIVVGAYILVHGYEAEVERKRPR